MPGDTAATLAQTAGGQAAALLTVCLVEMFCRNSTGHLLFELSLRILPRNSCLASMTHLSDLAETLANKLRPLAFGQHHAIHLTRIRETYLHAGIDVPPGILSSLLDRLSVDAMADLLADVQLALRDETVVVRIEGFQGLGGIVALVMALCPDDVLLLVEDGIIAKGTRCSVIVSIKHQQATSFHTERILRSGDKTFTSLPTHFRVNEFLAHPGRLSSYDHLSLNADGCLASMVEQLLVNVTVQSPTKVILRLADLITATICSFCGPDFSSALSQFPQDGLRSLLGPPAQNKARARLGTLFGIAPSLLGNIEPIASYEALRQSLQELVPDEEACECSQCLGTHIWANLGPGRPPCRLRSVWGGLQDLIGQAVLLCFVDTDLQVIPITQFPRTKMGRHLCRRLLLRANLLGDGSYPPCEPQGREYSAQDLHDDLCALLGTVPCTAGQGHNLLGTSNGATSIFPSTLDISASNNDHIVRYRVVDGQFHDGYSYYKALIERPNIVPRPHTDTSLLHDLKSGEGGLGPSSLGVHSNLMLSVRPAHNSLTLRVTAMFTGKAVDASFYDMHLAFLATSVAPPCDHDPAGSCTLLDWQDSFLASGVDTPVASDGRTSVALTHGNVDAQFLAGVSGVPTLFQGGSCLNCSMREAKDKGFELLIQS
jgi:sulfur transfer complex TusBCD TusB component (DsrH family)